MKLKSNVITGIIVACLLLGGMTLNAQGIYSGDNKTAVNTTPSATGGGLFRSDDDDWGDDPGDGGDPDPGGPSQKDPIGEGVLILSLLSGAYALVKRNIKNKHED